MTGRTAAGWGGTGAAAASTTSPIRLWPPGSHGASPTTSPGRSWTGRKDGGCSSTPAWAGTTRPGSPTGPRWRPHELSLTPAGIGANAQVRGFVLGAAASATEDHSTTGLASPEPTHSPMVRRSAPAWASGSARTSLAWESDSGSTSTATAWPTPGCVTSWGWPGGWFVHWPGPRASAPARGGSAPAAGRRRRQQPQRPSPGRPPPLRRRTTGGRGGTPGSGAGWGGPGGGARGGAHGWEGGRAPPARARYTTAAGERAEG